MMPVWSSPIASSDAEQIIPSDTRPYVFRAPISKPPGSTAPGVRQRDPVADGEVRGAADDVTLLAVAGGHLAVPDRLVESGQLLDAEHLGDDHAADVVPDRLDRLDLQAAAGQPPGHLLDAGVVIRGQADGRVLQQPGQR